MAAAVESINNKIVSHDEWLSARKALLEKEKELTRAKDEVTAQRAALPMVKIDKKYTFKDSSGSSLSLEDLFHGKDQLIIYHFMFGPDDKSGCHGCAHIGESLPDVRHLRLKNTNLVCVSRAPPAKLDQFKKHNGWTWPWVSSEGSDFNYDFHATVDESVCPVEMNFRTKEEMEAKGKKWWTGDVPGFSVFYRRGADVFHTYSTFERGAEGVMPTLHLLDLTPLGRRLDTQGPGEFRLKYEYEEDI
ncbi:hypothetical protein QQS21_000373 [Conoideocrella luteorostrata]|uniref:DUF899-domain-containing protein n=1 Tax=Conoideocrella luteorostrata TaxID=1105319 RepID=A0AAJ0G2V4_9HYPO|nr:hypothetical protein QQS21_000373 [Conoideocrella luteorostrata]